MPSLDFIQFETEMDFDEVLIFDGENTQTEVLEFFSGNLETLDHTHVEGISNQLTINFISDEDLNAGGSSTRGITPPFITHCATSS